MTEAVEAFCVDSACHDVLAAAMGVDALSPTLSRASMNATTTDMTHTVLAPLQDLLFSCLEEVGRLGAKGKDQWPSMHSVMRQQLCNMQLSLTSDGWCDPNVDNFFRRCAAALLELADRVDLGENSNAAAADAKSSASAASSDSSKTAKMEFLRSLAMAVEDQHVRN